jgi:hypothetical protein
MRFLLFLCCYCDILNIVSTAVFRDPLRCFVREIVVCRKNYKNAMCNKTVTEFRYPDIPNYQGLGKY